jgi:predicted nucleic acid-binding protein
MAFLADTNIGLRRTNVNDPEHPLVTAAVRELLRRGETLYYTQQNRREFWNVCTRPLAVNGLDMSIADTLLALGVLDALFTRLPDVAGTGPEWDRLVAQYQVTGRAVHDAQLVASMRVHGISHILTLNVADFARYAGEITVVHPQNV